MGFQYFKLLTNEFKIEFKFDYLVYLFSSITFLPPLSFLLRLFLHHIIIIVIEAETIINNTIPPMIPPMMAPVLLSLL